MPVLPIDSLLPEIRRALLEARAAVIQAPPGAGKTTRVPLALLNAPWLAGLKLIMLEPRRLAARAAAHYMAAQLGERIGETVGYRVRMDTRIGPGTRIEVVTEGVLTRLLQADPALSDYGLVIFDEFHERSLQADLSLALCLDARQVLRPEMRVLIMSATLDGQAVARLLGSVPLLSSEGRGFPVDTLYRPLQVHERLEPQAANFLRQLLAEEAGSVLAFLPGAGEIRRTAARLESGIPSDVNVHLLFGDLPQAEQEAAIRPAAPGRRKLVLTTAIAETSLTIEGVRVVVDAGWSRAPRFDPVSGLTRLVTRRVSQASADQRRGRAGRTQPGRCYRLWSAGERLEAHSPPEILQADLALLALELAQWGELDIARLAWLDPPPAAALTQARELLRRLEMLDTAGRITTHGRQALELPLPPRLAHMVIKSREWHAGWLACVVAALLSERDVRRPGAETHADAELRVHWLMHGEWPAVGVDRRRLQGVRVVAQRIAEVAGITPTTKAKAEQVGRVLALAYPDRIAKRRFGPEPRYLLSNGRGAFLAENDSLTACEWLAVAELDGNPREARIFMAARLDEHTVRGMFAAQIATHERVEWDDEVRAVRAMREQRLGAIVLESHPRDAADPGQVRALLLTIVHQRGLSCLPFTAALRSWQARVLLLRRVEGESWPDVSDPHLLVTLEEWLAPYLAGCTRLANVPLASALTALLTHDQVRLLGEHAPTHFIVPTGSRILLDYSAGETPVLAVRLQELFGLTRTPTIANGRVPLLLHLLSPAGRPLQITQNLPGFWRGSYQDVKKDMRGRYPKHVWPDDPLQAVPTRRAKRRT